MGKIISAKDVMIEGLDKTLYEIILDQSSDPIFCFDPEGRYLYINMAFSNAFGLMPSDIVGKKIWDVFPGEQGDMRFAAVKKAFETKEEVVLEVKVDAVSGVKYLITTVTPIMDALEQVKVAICISKEITQRKLMELELQDAKALTERKNVELDFAVKELYEKSITDGLTNVYNRQHAMELLERDILSLSQRTTPLTMLFIDIDHFKRVNDQFGHLTGDHVLQEFSHLLKQQFGLVGHVGRYGGEEFVVILKTVDLDEALKMTELMNANIAKTQFSEEHLTLTVSTGLAVYIEGESVSDFVKRTDNLMYTAKRAGRNRVAF